MPTVPSTLHVIERAQLIPRPLDEVFGFFTDASNLERITPPFLRFRIVGPAPIAMGRGTRIDYRLSLHGVPVRWRTLIARWEPGRCFVDLQLTGPFAYWEHTHTFEEGPAGTTIGDRIRYRMPFGPVETTLPPFRTVIEPDRIWLRKVTETVAGGFASTDPSVGEVDLTPVCARAARAVSGVGRQRRGPDGVDIAIPFGRIRLLGDAVTGRAIHAPGRSARRRDRPSDRVTPAVAPPGWAAPRPP